jgi:hypothetical protein
MDDRKSFVHWPWLNNLALAKLYRLNKFSKFYYHNTEGSQNKSLYIIVIIIIIIVVISLNIHSFAVCGEGKTAYSALVYR